MAKTDLTIEIEKAIQKEVLKPMGVFGCLEVTIGWYGKGRVDFMTMDSKEMFRCYEIKVTKSDFKSQHGHNFVGHYNYYVMPIEIYEEVKAEIQKEIGVYTWNGKYLNLIKRPRKQELKADKDVLKNSIIRCLYRDSHKINESENVKYLNKLKTKLARLEREKDKYYKESRDFQNSLYQELGHDKFLDFRDKYNL